MPETTPDSPQPFGVFRARFVSAAAGGNGLDLQFQLLDSGAQLTRRIPASVTPGDETAAFLELLTGAPFGQPDATGQTDNSLMLDPYYGREFDLHIGISPVPTPEQASDEPRQPTPPSPDDPYFEQLSAGEAHVEAGEHQEALNCFLSILESDPTHAEAYNNVGVVCWQLGKTAEAREFLEKALQSDPANENAFYNLVELVEQTSNIDEARFRFLKFELGIPESTGKVDCRRRLFGIAESTK